MTAATAEEIAELLGERAEDAIVDRIEAIGVTLTEVQEALDDLDFQLRLGEWRKPSTSIVDEIRSLLEELPYFEPLMPEEDDLEAEYEGFSVIEGDELHRAP